MVHMLFMFLSEACNPLYAEDAWVESAFASRYISTPIPKDRFALKSHHWLESFFSVFLLQSIRPLIKFVRLPSTPSQGKMAASLYRAPTCLHPLTFLTCMRLDARFVAFKVGTISLICSITGAANNEIDASAAFPQSLCLQMWPTSSSGICANWTPTPASTWLPLWLVNQC